MGFRISWVGFEGVDQAACLSFVGMTDTGHADEANEAPFSMATLPTGWTILFSNDFEFASEQKLAELSKCGRVVGCSIHEGIMYSSAASYLKGRRLWFVDHDSSQSIIDLTLDGTLPAEFDAIRARLVSEQEASGGEQSDTDYIFDIPVELAAHCTGYRHDRWQFDWGEPEFSQVVPVVRGNKGWWRRLLGYKR